MPLHVTSPAPPAGRYWNDRGSVPAAAAAGGQRQSPGTSYTPSGGCPGPGSISSSNRSQSSLSSPTPVSHPLSHIRLGFNAGSVRSSGAAARLRRVDPLGKSLWNPRAFTSEVVQRHRLSPLSTPPHDRTEPDNSIVLPKSHPLSWLLNPRRTPFRRGAAPRPAPAARCSPTLWCTRSTCKFGPKDERPVLTCSHQDAA